MNDLVTQLQWLDDKQPEMLNLVKQLCNQNSGTKNLPGIAAVRQQLLAAFESLGGQTELLQTDPHTMVDDSGTTIGDPLEQAIHIVKRPDAKRKVMLCIHMDTVYASDHPFQECVMLDNGHLNGPGVADAKGGLVVMLYALKMLEQSPLADKIGWEVLMNPDEEIGSPGSKRIIEARAPHCDFGMLFEPSLPDGTLVSWRKGTGNFAFVVRGKAAHSGREFEKGRNAIVALSRLLDHIDQLNVNPDVTFNAGRISGGGPLNMVPDLAIGRVNVRAKTRAQMDQATESLERLTAAINGLDGISVEMSGGFTSPPKVLCEKAAAIQTRIESCGEALGIPVSWRGTGGACDGNKFAAAGLPNIDTLGPQGGNIHSSNEYLIVESLVPRAKLAALILLDYAASEN
jgi:glutamate carboxypeptidase